VTPPVFHRILVPVDFTPKALRAARVAARIAGEGSGATLLHVIERIDDDLRGLDRFYRKLDAAARRKIQPFVELFERRGVPVRVVIVYGNRLREVLRLASELRCDLIVMASHRIVRNRAGEGWGTLSYKVGLLSACPVLLVK
jgi:nucleotide-binding universal stress UspA family protein